MRLNRIGAYLVDKRHKPNKETVNPRTQLNGGPYNNGVVTHLQFEFGAEVHTRAAYRLHLTRQSTCHNDATQRNTAAQTFVAVVARRNLNI